ncbi:hypothetical protein ACTXT7_016819 [Hymenolepis weldensis]
MFSCGGVLTYAISLIEPLAKVSHFLFNDTIEHMVCFVKGTIIVQKNGNMRLNVSLMSVASAIMTWVIRIQNGGVINFLTSVTYSSSGGDPESDINGDLLQHSLDYFMEIESQLGVTVDKVLMELQVGEAVKKGESVSTSSNTFILQIQGNAQGEESIKAKLNGISQSEAG